MGSVSVEEIPDEQRFFTEFWNFRKKYYIPEDDDDFWNSLINEGDALADKYNNPFFDQLMLLEFNDVDRRFSEAQGRPWETDPVDRLYEKIKERRK